MLSGYKRRNGYEWYKSKLVEIRKTDLGPRLTLALALTDSPQDYRRHFFKFFAETYGSRRLEKILGKIASIQVLNMDQKGQFACVAVDEYLSSIPEMAQNGIGANDPLATGMT